MRRALILLLLLGGTQLILPLGLEVPGSRALLTFGFLILAAYTVGEIADDWGVPKIVGYLIAGILFGPALLGTVSHEAVLRLSPVNQLAVALIAFLAGAELKLQELRERGRSYFRILGAEMPLTFAAMIAAVFILHPYIPVLRDAQMSRVAVYALLFASIIVAHSPAATLGLLTETRARGPVARTTLGVVLVSDVFLVILFSLVVTVCRLIVPPPGTAHPTSVLTIVWEIAGAMVVGGAIGGIVSLYLRFVQRELLLFGIIVAMVGAEVARLAHVELLLTLLAAGFVTENFTPGGAGEALRHAVERAAAPVFVVFFALAGAAIRVSEVVALIGIVAPLAVVRALAIWGGTRVGTRWAGVGIAEQRYLWLGLIAQAGVAIGLASVVATVYPDIGASIRTIALAVIAINQLFGPILFKRALVANREIPLPEPEDQLTPEPARST